VREQGAGEHGQAGELEGLLAAAREATLRWLEDRS